ncbi:MAG: LytTR family DNA-binding domain-containing protein [Bacteroidota bacterium]
MRRYKAIIVDDEKNLQEVLILLLKNNCPQIDVLDTASSALEGIKKINIHKPDIVFLDVEMPHGTGFDLLEGLTQRSFDVIFISAYGHYAVKAFKYSAMDYILKPVDIDDLINAVNRVISNHNNNKKNEQYEILKEYMNTGKSNLVAIPTNESIEFVNPNDIIRVEGDGNYVAIYLDNGNKMYVSKIIKDIEELLPVNMFYRPHKSHLINLKKVKRYIMNDGGSLEMNDGSIVPLARRQKNDFLERLSPKLVDI